MQVGNSFTSSTIRLRKHALQPGQTEQFQAEDIFVPTGSDSIENKSSKLDRDWARKMPNPRATVGILCERGWQPETDADPVLQIADAVLDSGARPKLLFTGETVADQMKSVDALAIPGGRDVDPKFYGQSMGPGMANSKPDADFDKFEIDCIRAAFESGMPMLGHCRGEQIMNVAGGGTLVQDIPTEFESPPAGVLSMVRKWSIARPKTILMRSGWIPFTFWWLKKIRVFTTSWETRWNSSIPFTTRP